MYGIGYNPSQFKQHIGGQAEAPPQFGTPATPNFNQEYLLRSPEGFTQPGMMYNNRELYSMGAWNWNNRRPNQPFAPQGGQPTPFQQMPRPFGGYGMQGGYPQPMMRPPAPSQFLPGIGGMSGSPNQLPWADQQVLRQQPYRPPGSPRSPIETPRFGN